jgi:hypothetical protein
MMTSFTRILGYPILIMIDFLIIREWIDDSHLPRRDPTRRRADPRRGVGGIADSYSIGGENDG